MAVVGRWVPWEESAPVPAMAGDGGDSGLALAATAASAARASSSVQRRRVGASGAGVGNLRRPGGTEAGRCHDGGARGLTKRPYTGAATNRVRRSDADQPGGNPRRRQPQRCRGSWLWSGSVVHLRVVQDPNIGSHDAAWVVLRLTRGQTGLAPRRQDVTVKEPQPDPSLRTSGDEPRDDASQGSGLPERHATSALVCEIAALLARVDTYLPSLGRAP